MDIDLKLSLLNLKINAEKELQRHKKIIDKSKDILHRDWF